jgi:hypothetical protein
MPSLLGKARIVDDPRLNRPVTLDLWQHHLTHLGQDLLVRPGSLTDKMQQRLMLRSRTSRRRDRRHRFYALAITRQHQAQAIVAQRISPIRVADHAHKTIDIAPKPRFNVLRSVQIHPQPPKPKWESSPLRDSQTPITATF